MTQQKNKKNSRLFKILAGLSALTAAIFFLSACRRASDTRTAGLLDAPYVKEADTMGTTVTVTSYTPGKAARQAVDHAIEIATDYDRWVTVNQKGSVIDQINAAAGTGQPVKLSRPLYQLISDAYSLSSAGTGYDVTVGPLTQLWHIGFPDAKKPSQTEINAALPLINYRYMQLDATADTVYLTQKGAQLDLGSIAKGYTTKLMTAYLKSHGVKNAIVDIGHSSIYAIGHSPNGRRAWNLGIVDPNHPEGNHLGILTAENQFVSSSGIYERYLKADGKTYSHILNPKTGYPFDNDIQGVTIVGKNDATFGDGVSTTVFALGTKKGYDYVLKNHLQAVFVDKNDKVYLTPGLKKKFTLDSHSRYKIAPISTLKGQG